MACLPDKGVCDLRLEPGRFGRFVRRAEVGLYFIGILKELRVIFRDLRRNDLDELQEPHHLRLRLRRDVGAGIKGFVPRGGEDRGRPAARAAVEQHMDPLVVFVDVGALLLVDLDADEVFIEVGRYLLVFEHLVLHHVAPVAGAVADGDEDRLVLLLRFVKGFVAPGVPVDRVVLVLLQVGGVFVLESVCHQWVLFF